MQAEQTEFERLKRVSQTRWGCLLLAIAFPINRILVFELVAFAVVLLNRGVPLLESIGLLVALIGITLVVRGRKAFGPRHSKFVVASVLLYLLSLVLAVVFMALFLKATLDAAVAGPRFLLPAFRPFVAGIIGSTALAGVAEVYLVHELQGPFGRYLLYAALVATVAVPVGTVIVLIPSFEAALANIANGVITSANDRRLLPLYNAGAILDLVAIIPSFLFSAAYVLAWRRLGPGGIPTSEAEFRADLFPPEETSTGGAIESPSRETELKETPSGPVPPP